MKNILKGTIIFAVCLTLAACGTSSPQDITIQSITEPMTTMQTVGNVLEVTAVAESTIGTVRVTGTEDWVEPVATEPDDPNAGLETEAYTGVTFPETMDDWVHSYIIRDLFYQELPVYTEHFDDSGAYYENGNNSYSKCNESYKKLLVERFLDDPEAFEFFGGAFFCDGYMHLMITDWERLDDIFGDPLAKLNSVHVRSCNYSYTYLLEVWETVQQNEKVTGHLINAGKNCVEIYGAFTDEDKENTLAALEAAGLDPEALEIMVVDEIPAANPC